MAFTVSRRTTLAPEVAWSAVTDLAEHTRHVPLTDLEVPPGGLVLGTEVVAWTRLGPLAAADRMLVTALEPGRRLRLVKTGRFLHGWADIRVTADPGPSGGALVEWTEEIWLPGLRRLTRPRGRPARPRALLPRRGRAARPGGRRCRERPVTWAVSLALLGIAVVVGAAWLLGRPRSAESLAGLGEPGDDDATAQHGRVTSRWARASAARCAATGWTRSTRCSTPSRPGSPSTTSRSPGDAATRRRPPPARHRRQPAVRPRSPPGGSPPERPAQEDEPPPRPGPAAGRDEAPGCRTPRAAAPVGPVGPAGLPAPRRLGAGRPHRQPAHRLPVAGRAGPAGVRVVLRCRGPQPDHPVEPALHRPAELPRRRQPDGQRRRAGAGHPARPADPARGPVGDLPRRRAARAGAHGIRVVLAVPPPPRRAPARRRDRCGLRRVRAGHGVARQRAPQLRGAVPRAAHRRPGAAHRRGAPPGA